MYLLLFPYLVFHQETSHVSFLSPGARNDFTYVASEYRQCAPELTHFDEDSNSCGTFLSLSLSCSFHNWAASLIEPVPNCPTGIYSWNQYLINFVLQCVLGYVGFFGLFWFCLLDFTCTYQLDRIIIRGCYISAYSWETKECCHLLCSGNSSIWSFFCLCFLVSSS